MKQKILDKTTNPFFIKRRILAGEPSGADKTLVNIARNADGYFNCPDAHFLKNDHSTSVIKIQDNGRMLVIRRDNPVSLLTFARRLFKQSRSMKIWKKAQWLKKEGLETITPLAVIEDYLFFIRLRSFIIVELIEGRTFKSFLGDPAVSQNSKSNMSSQILSLVKKWHELGITHGDPKASNIMVNKNGATLIDIEDVSKPRTKSGKMRAFARDWAIILHNLQHHGELRKKSQDKILAVFDGDQDDLSRRLVHKCLAREHAIVKTTFQKVIPPEEIQTIITDRKAPRTWITLEKTNGFIHLFQETKDLHLLVSFHGSTRGASKVKGIFSMALALGICGIDHVKILDGGKEEKTEYLVYSTRGTQTVETILKQLENDPRRQSELLSKVGAASGKLHLRGFIHGDLSLATTYARKTDNGYTIAFAAVRRTKWYAKRLKRKISNDRTGIYNQLNSRNYRHLFPAFQTAYHKAFGTPGVDCEKR